MELFHGVTGEQSEMFDRQNDWDAIPLPLDWPEKGRSGPDSREPDIAEKVATMGLFVQRRATKFLIKKERWEKD